MSPELTGPSCLKTCEETRVRRGNLTCPAQPWWKADVLGDWPWILAYDCVATLPASPRMKIYEVRKQLLLEPIQSLHSVINSPPSAVLSTPRPVKEGQGSALQASEPPTPAPATESERRPAYVESISLIVPSAVMPKRKD